MAQDKKNKMSFFIGLLSLICLSVGIPIAVVSCGVNTLNSNTVTRPDPIGPENTDIKYHTFNSQAGTHGLLHTTGYCSVVERLGISAKNTNLTNLNNDYLNNNLHKYPGYENVNVSIQNGSTDCTDCGKDNSGTVFGKLILAINGTYNAPVAPSYPNAVSADDASVININNAIVDVTGFINPYQNFDIQQAKLNYKNWFNFKQPLSGDSVSSFTQEISELKTFLTDDTKINFGNNNLITWKEAIDSKSIEVKSMALGFETFTNNKIKFSNISLNVPISTYESGKWVKKDTRSIKQITTNSVSFNIPTLRDLMKVMIDQVELLNDKLSELQSYTPSWYVARHRYATNKIQNGMTDSTTISNYFNWNEVKNKYAYYTKDKTVNFIPLFQDNAFEGDDANGTLNATFTIVSDQDENDRTITRKYNITGLKQINTLIGSNTNNIISLIPGSSQQKRISSVLDADITNAINSGTETTISKPSSSIFMNNQINLFNWDSDNETFIQNFKKNYSNISIYDNVIEADQIAGYQNSGTANTPFINIDNGLINWKGINLNDSVGIDSLVITLPETLNISIAPTSNKAQINIDCNIEIGFSCYQRGTPVIIPAKISTIITK